MIRVNLLNPRRPRSTPSLRTLLLPRGRSAFISRREMVLALGLLAAGAAMLHIYLGVSAPESPRPHEKHSQLPTAAPATVPAVRGKDARLRKLEGTPNQQAAKTETVSLQGSERPWAAIEEVQRPPTDPLPREPASSPSPPATPPAGAPKLRNAHFSMLTGSLRLSLEIGERPTYKTFRLREPNRVVVDIPGVWVMLPREQHWREVDHPLVSRIRVGQFKADPPIARVVLDVSGYPNLLLFPHSNGLDIQVSSTTE